MNFHNFENLDVWKRACRLAADVCVATHNTKLYPQRDQHQKSAISIPSNIAEGSERPTVPDFLRFLGYAKGSSGKLRTQLMIYKAVSLKLGIPNFEGISEMIQEAREIAQMIEGLKKISHSNILTSYI